MNYEKEIAAHEELDKAYWIINNAMKSLGESHVKYTELNKLLTEMLKRRCSFSEYLSKGEHND